MLEILKKLPQVPGIFIFRNAEQRVIYVGKASNIYTSVVNIFENKNKPLYKDLIKECRFIAHVTSKTEDEAAKLQTQLIEELEPKYNELLGKEGWYIGFFMDGNPHIAITKNTAIKSVYFGPFSDKKECRKKFDYILKTFKLSQCGIKMPQGCLEYLMGECAGGCRADFNKEEYVGRMKLAIAFLLQTMPEKYVKDQSGSLSKTFSTNVFDIEKDN